MQVWHIENTRLQSVKLDFSSSDQGRMEARALYCDDILLANALELTNFQGSYSQIIVCGNCGQEGCQSGGWAGLRLAGDFVFLIPAFDLMKENEEDPAQYAPPGYIVKMGLPCFSLKTYEDLVLQIKDLPVPNELELLTVGEALNLLQWAPNGQVLGRFPNLPQLDDKLILDVVDGNKDEELEKVRRFIQVHSESFRPLTPALVDSNFHSIDLILDLPGFPVWTGFTANNYSTLILISENMAFDVR